MKCYKIKAESITDQATGVTDAFLENKDKLSALSLWDFI